MTPMTGFIIAVIAGWIVRDGLRAAMTVVVPWLAVLTAQTWIIAAGRAVSPPSTVSRLPQAIGYWLVQAVFLVLALGIAGQLGALRARRALPHNAAGGTGRQAAIASGLLAAATAVFIIAWLLDSAPVARHAAEGSPPVQGAVGMVLCIVVFAALSAATFRRRRAVARAQLAEAGTGVAGPAAGRQPAA